MCGIVGYIGKRQASELLVEGLSKLEYRGYDSAGVAIIEDEKIRAQHQNVFLTALSCQGTFITF